MVGIILWAGYWGQSIAIWKRYSKPIPTWGVKGFKVDFMDRDDQTMVDFWLPAVPKQQPSITDESIITEHIKPTGLAPHIPQCDQFWRSVTDCEQLKWAPPSIDMVTYDVTMPYIRMRGGNRRWIILKEPCVTLQEKTIAPDKRSERDESGHRVARHMADIRVFRIAAEYALRQPPSIISGSLNVPPLYFRHTHCLGSDPCRDGTIG